MAKHSELSPSKADRWSRCPGSVALCRGLADNASTYADEGTVAHALAVECFVSGLDSLEFLGEVAFVTENGDVRWSPYTDAPVRSRHEVDEEMVTAVGTYVDRIRALGGFMLTEQFCSLEEVLPDPDAAGTADCVVFVDNTLYVHDLKYGRGQPVYAFDEAEGRPNPQLVLYALGVYYDVAPVVGVDVQQVVLAIHQPRIGNYSEHHMTLDELLAEGKRLARCAADTKKPNAPLVPGPKQCRWCPAKAHAVCPAIAQEVLATVTGAAVAEFDDLTQEDLLPPDQLTDEQVAGLMGKLDWIEDWSSAVRARAVRVLEEGRPLSGWKLVAGRKGNRRWAEGAEPQVIEYLTGTVRLKQEDIFTRKLVSPTRVSKLVGKVQYKRLEEFITQSPGSPAIVPSHDPRPAILPGVAGVDEFETIEKE
jgi:hypothetical protein